MEREIKEFGLTREELIAALVEDSIGYLTPRATQLHIERGKEMVDANGLSPSAGHGPKAEPLNPKAERPRAPAGCLAGV